MIRDAIEECNFSGNILKETDTPEKHKHDILTIHMMRREFEVFDSALKALPTKEHDIVFTFINKERKMLEIAEDRDLAYQTVKNLIGDIKKLLESRTVPYFQGNIIRSEYFLYQALRERNESQGHSDGDGTQGHPSTTR